MASVHFIMSDREEFECDGIASPRVNLRIFEERLLTFKNWPGKVNPIELAGAGFYFTKYLDCCKCVFCNLEIYKWELDDSPLIEHLKYKKYCPYLQVLGLTRMYRNNNTTSVHVKSATPNLVIWLFCILGIINLFVLYNTLNL